MNYLLRMLLTAGLLLVFVMGCSDMGEPEIFYPRIVIESDTVDFSISTIGSVQNRNIHIINSGEVDLQGNLTLVQDSSSFMLDPEGDFLVLADDTLSTEISFLPHSEFSYSGLIMVTSNDPAHPNLSVNLMGVGTAIPVPVLSLGSNQINFGVINTGDSAQQQITLSSTGNDTLVITSIDFELSVYQQDATLPLELIPGAFQTVTLSFQPAVAGSYDGTMTIHSNGTSTPDIVNLSGSAEDLVSYSLAVQPVWNASCTGCHGTSAGLNLSSYSQLMDGSSNGQVVIPGDGANSVIIKRLNGVGGLMPMNATALPAATIAEIERWIDQGALNN